MSDIAKQDDYSFEVSQEVREKMENAENLHTLIDEVTVQDLKPIHTTRGFYRVFKRTMDIIISFIGLLVLLIPALIVALVIFLGDRHNVIFSQYRVGRYGKRFKLYKFRTMRVDAPKYMSTEEIGKMDNQVTKVGKVLRKLSLDEIPQLFNVLKGDMSLIGPRPLIADEYEIHAMRMRFGVYAIRPGVTGMAQVHGRDLVTPAEKVRWDVKYVEQFGFWTDVKIFFLTIPKVFSCSGVVDKNKATAEAASPEETVKETETV